MNGKDHQAGTLDRATAEKIRRPLRLTRLGMGAERILRAFWPAATLMLFCFAFVVMGGLRTASVELFWITTAGSLTALILALIRGFLRFSLPTGAEAEARLDASLPGQPLTVLSDAQAIGKADPASVAVWRAHLARMASRAAGARAVIPNLQLAEHDPFALRYLALSLAVIALLGGSLGHISDLRYGAVAPSAAETLHVSWEGWAEPPIYTGRPDVYLNKQPSGTLTLPEGTRITLRLYGPADQLQLSEDISAKGAELTTDGDMASELRNYTLTVDRPGQLALEGAGPATGVDLGAGGQVWQIMVEKDMPPTVALTGPMDRKADGKMQQPFASADDYGVVKGEAQFTLDLSAVDRRFGLTVEPEPQAPLIYDLPRPGRGDSKDVKAVLAEDASEHPFANLPVIMTLSVTDALGQTASTAPEPVILPGRRFFDPLAAGVAELRRDLIWSRANGQRSLQLLRALTWQPDGFIDNRRAYLMLRAAVRQLDVAMNADTDPRPLPADVRDEVAKALWQVAILLEDGGLGDALARMQQAEERLSQAIRNGASADEIQKLMDELKRATDDYIDLLAEQSEPPDTQDQLAENQPGQSITGDQIQEMMDQIQKLMEEGRMAEAQALLDQLSALMRNLQVTQSQGGTGQDGQGKGQGKAMRDLQDTLRRQQDLADEAFRQQQGGTPRAEGEATEGEGGPAEDGEKLADRQQELRDQLGRQQGDLPNAEGPDADAARKSLDQAGRAMDEAEQALRDNDMAGAIDRQAEAIEQLHEGLRNMNRALSQAQKAMPGQEEGQANNSREVPLDPLGRAESSNGQISDNDSSVLQDQDSRQTARDILDEIRRRSADRARPESERDYLRRLLDPY